MSNENLIEEAMAMDEDELDERIEEMGPNFSPHALPELINALSASGVEFQQKTKGGPTPLTTGQVKKAAKYFATQL